MAIPGNFLSETASTIDPNNSGWTPLLNCTLPAAIGGRVGTGCLAVKSVASGETRARTVSSYPVVAWEEYEAFADASGTTVPERIGIRWLDAASAEISISWSLPTATASATWHRIAVAAEAPAGAARAQVVVSATPAAGAVTNYFENVYLGLPIRTTGNLMAFNTESIERDASDWHNENNCTIARQVPMVQWAVDNYVSGGHVLAMTVTANGDAWTRTSDWPAASPGVEYRAYCYLNPPTAGSVTWVELRFINSVGTTIGTTRGTLSAPGTGWYKQYASGVAPAGTDSVALAAGITGGTAGQILRIDGGVVTPVPVLREGSVVPYADASFEQGIGSWTVVSGVATLARLTPWGTDGLDGSYCMTVSSATATTSVIRSAKYPVGSAAGQAWTAESGMKVSAGGWTLTQGIRWYDAANVDLGSTTAAPGAVPTPNWWTLSQQVTAPAGATQAAIEYTLAATSVSSVLRMDKVGLWQSMPLTEVTATDADAYITLTLRELPLDSTITVWRVGPDGNRTLVRGVNGLINAELVTADVLVIEDYEAPLGMEVYYYAEARDSSNVISASRTSSLVTLDAGDTQYGWLKDPGYPARNCHVMIAKGPDWQRSIQQTKYHIRGASKPIVLSDVRDSLEGDLSIYTLTDDERIALHRLLDPGTILLWQAAPGHGVDDMYVSLGQITETRGGDAATDDFRIWTLPLTQVAMPITVGVASSAGRTGYDVLAENATGFDVITRYATGEDLLFGRRRA